MKKLTKRILKISATVLSALVIGGGAIATASNGDSPITYYKNALKKNLFGWEQHFQSRKDENNTKFISQGTFGVKKYSNWNASQYLHLPPNRDNSENIQSAEQRAYPEGSPWHYGEFEIYKPDYKYKQFLEQNVHQWGIGNELEPWAQNHGMYYIPKGVDTSDWDGIHNGEDRMSYDDHFDYDDIGRWHGYLEWHDLQHSIGENSVLRAQLPDKGTSDSQIMVAYPNAGRKAVKSKKTGKWRFKKVSILVTCSDFRYYSPWTGPRSIVFSRNLAKGIYYNGVREMKVTYTPFTTDKHGNPQPVNLNKSHQVHMYFHTINGLSSYASNERYDKQGQDIAPNNQDYTRWDNYAQQHNSYTNPRYKDYDGHWYGAENETGESVKPDYKNAPNGTGEYTPIKHGTKIWRYNSADSAGAQTRSIFRIPSQWAVGGKYNTTDTGNGVRSVIITMHGNTLPLFIGSGVGYGSTNPDTNIKLPKNQVKEGKINVSYIDSNTGKLVYSGDTTTGQVGKKFHYMQYEENLPKQVTSQHYSLDNKFKNGWNLNSSNFPSKYELKAQHCIIYVHRGKIPNKKYPIQKTNTHHTLTHPNEDFTYKINGKVPYRPTIAKGSGPTSPKKEDNRKSEVDKEVTNWIPYTAYHTHYYWMGSQEESYQTPYTAYYPYKHSVFDHWHYYDANPNDHYQLTDTLPGDVSIKDISAYDTQNGKNIPVTHNGNKIKMYLNVHQLVDLRNQPFQIKVHVKANHLPDIKYAGWYYFYNRAHSETNLYNENQDRNINDESNEVSNRIKREHYNIYHYDYNWDGIDHFMVQDVLNHQGYNNQFHRHFNMSHSVIKRIQGYAWYGSYLPIHILHHAKDKQGHLYRFCYDEGLKTAYVYIGNGTPSNDHAKNANPNGLYADSNTAYNDNFKMNYYKPYLVPIAKINKFGRFVVDTDKQNNNLPFKLDLTSRTTLYNVWKDYGGGRLNIDIQDANNNHTLYHTSNSLHAILQHKHHGKMYSEITGKLDTRDDPKAYSKGQAIPLRVHFSFTNPGLIHMIISGLTPNHNLYSRGYVSTEDTMTGNDFNDVHKQSENGDDKLDSDGSTSTFTEPERTIKYFGTTPVRVQHEQFSMHQRHDTTGKFKTGYGVRADMVLMYRGWINTKEYGQDGTTSDFAFPNSWNENTQKGGSSNNDITYTNNNHSGNEQKGASMMDRLENRKPQFHAGIQYLPPSLDDVNSWNNGDQNFSSDVDYQFDHSFEKPWVADGDRADVPGEYVTGYQFYPRKLVRGSGAVMLNTDKDPLASNTFSSKVDSIIGTKSNSDNRNSLNDTDSTTDLNVMFTPMFLRMDKYNTVFDKTYASRLNNHRLGGNWFNFKDNRDDVAYGHMFNAFNYPNDTNSEYSKAKYNLQNGQKGDREHNDELSLQPTMSRMPIKMSSFSKMEQKYGDIVKNWPWVLYQ